MSYGICKYFRAAKAIRRLLFVPLALFLFSSCTAVIRKDLLDSGIRDFSLQELTGVPDQYKGKHFILGGTIARTTLTEQGSLVDALYVPVDSSGYLRGIQAGRPVSCALPQGAGNARSRALRPQRTRYARRHIYRSVRPGKIGQMDYPFPEVPGRTEIPMTRGTGAALTPTIGVPNGDRRLGPPCVALRGIPTIIGNTPFSCLPSL